MSSVRTFFFKTGKVSNAVFSRISKHGLTMLISEKYRLVTQTFSKIQPLKLALFFLEIAFAKPNYSYRKIHILPKLQIIRSSFIEQLKF